MCTFLQICSNKFANAHFGLGEETRLTMLLSQETAEFPPGGSGASGGSGGSGGLGAETIP